MNFIGQLITYFICFAISLYGLSAVDYSKFIKKNKVYQAQVLYIIISMIIAYLLGKFILAITFKTFTL